MMKEPEIGPGPEQLADEEHAVNLQVTCAACARVCEVLEALGTSYLEQPCLFNVNPLCLLEHHTQ
jgi:hypothetical protein